VQLPAVYKILRNFISFFLSPFFFLSVFVSPLSLPDFFFFLFSFSLPPRPVVDPRKIPALEWLAVKLELAVHSIGLCPEWNCCAPDGSNSVDHPSLQNRTTSRGGTTAGAGRPNHRSNHSRHTTQNQFRGGGGGGNFHRLANNSSSTATTSSNTLTTTTSNASQVVGGSGSHVVKDSAAAAASKKRNPTTTRRLSSSSNTEVVAVVPRPVVNEPIPAAPSSRNSQWV
jgi:hypothetical protein